MHAILILSLLSLWPENFARAAPCHALDFDSYFIAQNAKQNLQKINQTNSPNFAGHYLLLRNEMMMETVYLIADCESGKFAHEKLTGDAQFGLSSAEVTLKAKNSLEPETLVWTGERFLKVENKSEKAKEPAPTTGAQVGFEKRSRADQPRSRPNGGSALEAQYDALFAEYPAGPARETCAKPKFDRYFVAQKSKATLLKENPAETRPNFAGAYRIFKNPSLYGQQILITDCSDGNFLPTTVNGSPQFALGSRLLRAEQANHFPDLYLWQESDWVQIPDPVQNKDRILHQNLNPELSKILFESLGARRSESISRFENLEKTDARQAVFSFLHAHALVSGQCEKKPRQVSCSVDYR